MIFFNSVNFSLNCHLSMNANLDAVGRRNDVAKRRKSEWKVSISKNKLKLRFKRNEKPHLKVNSLVSVRLTCLNCIPFFQRTVSSIRESDSVFRTVNEAIQHHCKKIKNVWQKRLNYIVAKKNDELRRIVEDTKRKKWCVQCLKEVKFDDGLNKPTCSIACLMEIM